MRRIILGLIMLVMLAPAAWAQTGKHLAVGGGIGGSKYSDSDFSSKNPGFSIAYRIRLHPEPKDGWGWRAKTGFGWSKLDTHADIGGTSTLLGKLQTITIMGGFGPEYRRGPLEVGASLVAGPSFNHFDVASDARAGYVTRTGSTLNDIHAKASLAARSGVSAWYDLGSWFALHGTVSYIINRPKVETTLDGVATASKWKTDHGSYGLGVVVGIF